MYNSKTPRDLNHDPEPWKSTLTGARYARRSKYGHAQWLHKPRPEFDHVQHNEPNPILVDMREFSPIYEDWLVALDDDAFTSGTPRELGLVTAGHIDHARKVLTRLARLGSAS